jgi:hypothetical protein
VAEEGGTARFGEGPARGGAGNRLGRRRSSLLVRGGTGGRLGRRRSSPSQPWRGEGGCGGTRRLDGGTRQQEKRPREPASAPRSHTKMLRHFLAYRWSRAVGYFEQRASRAEGAKNDAKHEFEPMRGQPSPRATLPNAPKTTGVDPLWVV